MKILLLLIVSLSYVLGLEDSLKASYNTDDYQYIQKVVIGVSDHIKKIEEIVSDKSDGSADAKTLIVGVQKERIAIDYTQRELLRLVLISMAMKPTMDENVRNYLHKESVALFDELIDRSKKLVVDTSPKVRLDEERLLRILSGPGCVKARMLIGDIYK